MFVNEFIFLIIIIASVALIITKCTKYREPEQSLNDVVIDELNKIEKESV